MSKEDREGSPSDASPDDDATVVRTDGRSSARPVKADAEDRGEPRTGEPSAPPVSADDATVIRDRTEEPASPSPGADDATVIRDQTPSPESAPPGADDSTVIRGSEPTAPKPETPAGDATLVRSGRDITLRDEEIGDEDATIIRETAKVITKDERSGADDATVMRGDDGAVGGDDATVMKAPAGDDSTVLAAGQTTRQEADTTYIASVGSGQAKEAPSSSQAGRLLKNRFVLEEKLGSGGMGDVYKGLDLRAQEAQDRNPYVAIKLLNERFSQHKDAFISLQREASKTRSMHSKNIMSVYDFDREGDTFYMAMELLDGEPLDDFLKSHPEGVSRDDAWNIIRGYCEGLQAAHAENIVHSDFKPGNIYYTTEKIAKVFDFGIARAVQNPGTSTEGKEETVFDPGSLGALTPTYASLEMLTGEVPTKSDDVYAAALIAYELFTGKHPYNRVPADKALAQGLVPEPIPNLKRRHWRALRRGLELSGDDRTPTIDEFMEGMFSEDLPILRYSIIGAVAAGIIGFGVYTMMFAPEADQELIATQNTLQLRKADLEELLGDPKFTEEWAIEVQGKLRELNKLNETLVVDYSEPSDPAVEGNRELIMESHVSKIRKLREQYSASGDRADQQGYLEQAEEQMDHLSSYFAFDPDVVRSAELALRDSITLRDLELDRIRQEEEAAARIAAEEEAARIAQQQAAAAAEARDNQYIEDATELFTIYKCKDGISDLNRVPVLIASLESTYPERYDSDRPGIIGGLVKCIDRTKVKRPDHAREIKRAALTAFPEERVIAAVDISDLDGCAKRNLIGSGSRPRSWCEDALTDGGTGPELVVIPEKRDVPMFAISRTEIKVGDYNSYCELAGCQRLGGSPSIPATGISLQQANAYIAWLSDQSGRTYRLPTAIEWTYAAKTDREAPLDPNINCTVDSRGVRLGENLLSALSGKPNKWGLYHQIGNAQEWAVSGEDLMALGGAHTDPKAECTADMSRLHTGQADAVTGFRVLREI